MKKVGTNSARFALGFIHPAYFHRSHSIPCYTFEGELFASKSLPKVVSGKETSCVPCQNPARRPGILPSSPQTGSIHEAHSKWLLTTLRHFIANDVRRIYGGRELHKRTLDSMWINWADLFRFFVVRFALLYLCGHVSGITRCSHINAIKSYFRIVTMKQGRTSRTSWCFFSLKSKCILPPPSPPLLRLASLSMCRLSEKLLRSIQSFESTVMCVCRGLLNAGQIVSYGIAIDSHADTRSPHEFSLVHTEHGHYFSNGGQVLSNQQICVCPGFFERRNAYATSIIAVAGTFWIDYIECIEGIHWMRQDL